MKYKQRKDNVTTIPLPAGGSGNGAQIPKTPQCIYRLCAPFLRGCTKSGNTPTIIRFPFEKLVREHKDTTLVRLNMDEAVIPEEFGERAVGINEDMVRSIGDLLKEVVENDK